jgi:hypothetical protein
MVRSKIYYCLNLNSVLEGNLKLFPLPLGFGVYIFASFENICRVKGGCMRILKITI